MIICGLILALIFTQAGHPSSKAQAEDDIREAVFRYQFVHDAPQQKPHTKVHFIAIENKQDPDDAFLKRFADRTPIVKKESQAAASNNGTGGVIDKETKGAGIIFRIAQLKWINDSEIEVEAHFHVAMLVAGGCKYRVLREGNKWVVKECLSKWES
jgi:hypothetical protein